MKNLYVHLSLTVDLNWLTFYFVRLFVCFGFFLLVFDHGRGGVRKSKSITQRINPALSCIWTIIAKYVVRKGTGFNLFKYIGLEKTLDLI